MAQVFISWASPDKLVVDRLVSRFNDLGWTCWFSKRDMNAGEEPHQRVLQEIQNSVAAIFLLSDQAAERPWIANEIAWCYQAQLPSFPAAVGPLADNAVPELIRGVHRRDLSPGPAQEAELRRFVDDIVKGLQVRPPIWVPCALFAMTAHQYEQLTRNDEAWKSIERLCESTGLSGGQLDQHLRGRYKATALEFAPFQDDISLHQVVLDAQSKTNQVRIAANRPPIALRWCQEELIGRAAAMRDEWSKGSSLLIVDSVSVCHPDIKNYLMSLPDARRLDRSAVLWVPPYTRYTAVLEGLIDVAASYVPRLQDAFRSYRNREFPERWTAFDIGTPASLADWMYRVVCAQPDEAPAFPQNKSIVAGLHPTRFATLAFNKAPAP